MEPRNDNSYYSQEVDEVVSVGNWILTFIVLAIPIFNIIMYFIWAFSSNTNKNKRNFCRASLIMAAIAFVLRLLFF